jgi:nucleoside phosphorylase
MAHAGGRSQAEERLCEAATILRISRRRKTPYGGFRLISVHPRPDGSDYGDMPRLFDTHYPDRPTDS